MRKATEQEIIRKHNEGLTLFELRDYFGYANAGHVGEVIKRNGLKPNKHYKCENEIRDLRSKGLGYTDIARIVGMDKKNVARTCRILGIEMSRNEISEQQRLIRNKQTANAEHMSKIRPIVPIEEWRSRIEEKSKGKFELVEKLEYKNEARFIIRCRDCGTEREITAVVLRPSNNKSLRCKACFEIQRKRAKEEKQRNYEKYLENLRIARIHKKRIQVGMNFCKCGELLPVGRKTCDECKRKTLRNIERRNKTRRHRLKVGNQDKDITLQGLFERDGGICYLCGLPCEYSDHHTDERGNFIAGANYPSIEHLVPLCKGGSDTWDNIKLAHHLCNSIKGTKEMVG